MFFWLQSSSFLFFFPHCYDLFGTKRFFIFISTFAQGPPGLPGLKGDPGSKGEKVIVALYWMILMRTFGNEDFRVQETTLRNNLDNVITSLRLSKIAFKKKK